MFSIFNELIFKICTHIIVENDAKNFFERSTEMSQPAIDTRFSGTSKEMCQPSVDLSFSERSNRPFLESSNLSFQNSVVDKSLSERPIERSQPSIDTSFTERSKRSIHRLEDQHLLTIQDVYFNHRGMKLPKYDALVLFIPKDEKYVELLFKRLKMFKVCSNLSVCNQYIFFSNRPSGKKTFLSTKCVSYFFLIAVLSAFKPIFFL